MTISIWRYSHFLLALISSLFLIIACITGIILAVEPISHQAKGFAVHNLDEVPLATTITALKENYEDVFSIEVESSGFVKASVLTADFETRDIYVDPKTGKQLGIVEERPYLYSFATNLHRSLFLKSIGRVFVGVFSLLLLFITVTGLLLLAQRQGGFKRLFAKVQKDYFELRYHVILSRWFFIPIVIVAATGVYLSAEKFELLPDASLSHKENPSLTQTQHFKNTAHLPLFKATTLNDVRQVDFPFSDDPEDFYQIALHDKEIIVHQQTGEIISTATYPFIKLASRFSWVLHTGEGSVWWSVVLLLASASILFFMYSGFVMSLNRRKKIKTGALMLDKDTCEFIILVGSETGTTYNFARRLYNSLAAAGKSTYLTELNKVSAFAKAKHIIILTATYGDGDPTTNARKFQTLFPKINQLNAVKYAVVGFGSKAYPGYCKFAVDVDAMLQAQANFEPLLPLHKIDNANEADFQNWVHKFSEQIQVPLAIELAKVKKVKRKMIPFKVIERTTLNIDNTFLLRLKPLQKINFTSGDLWSVFPEKNAAARQYSIARIDDDILLSIKKHEFGKGSSFLYQLRQGQNIKAEIHRNSHFHLPENTREAILIANGTGIAPFLGMLSQHPHTAINLFWGGRTAASSAIYEPYLAESTAQNKQLVVHKCYSKEAKKQYVQDLLMEQQSSLLATIKNGGVIMICGSLAMQHDTLDVIEKLCTTVAGITMDQLLQTGQLKMDCY